MSDSWSSPETRIKELETLLATERSARERADDSLQLALQVIAKIGACASCGGTGTPQCTSHDRQTCKPQCGCTQPTCFNCLGDGLTNQARSAIAALAPREDVASSSETIQSSPSPTPDGEQIFPSMLGPDDQQNADDAFTDHASLSNGSEAHRPPVENRDSGDSTLCANCGKVRSEHAVLGRCIWMWTPRVPTTEPDK